MQPISNSVWFAKMKDSYKILIITEHDKDVLNDYVLSTGYQGIKASSNLPLSLLSAIIISNDFKIQRDLNSVGTTMAGINNETLVKIKVPLLSKNEIEEYDKTYSPFIDELSILRQEKDKLIILKSSLLNKYF